MHKYNFIFSNIFILWVKILNHHVFFFSRSQRATLAEKEVNTLKEQLSSTSISSQSALASSTNTASMQNGCLAPSSLASPTMSDCSSSGNPLINSKSLNNNKCDEINENKMDTTNEHESRKYRAFLPTSTKNHKHKIIDHFRSQFSVFRPRNKKSNL